MKREDDLSREIYPLIPHEDWDRHQELTAQQLDRRVAFICGYDWAKKDILAWMEEHLIYILDGAGDRSEVIDAFKKYIEK